MYIYIIKINYNEIYSLNRNSNFWMDLKNCPPNKLNVTEKKIIKCAIRIENNEIRLFLKNFLHAVHRLRLVLNQ